MLTLSRHVNEAIRVGDIRILVSEFRGDKVRLSIEAPEEVSVHREEIWELVMDWKIDDGPVAERIKARMLEAGHKEPQIYDVGYLRIITSIDPSGDSGEDEYHVSVSRMGLKVLPNQAIRIAEKAFPNCIDWEVTEGEDCTHVWGTLAVEAAKNEN